MGLSKKKLKKQVKGQPEEYMEMAENVKKSKQAEKLDSALMDDLFAENKDKADLAKKREKLRKDRFKEIARGTPSQTEYILVKRLAKQKENREAAGIELPKRRSQKSKNELEDDEFGDLQDLWAAPAEVKSKKFGAWKEGFAKKDFVKVKAVVAPKSGQSYNPQFDKHQALLQEVAKKEEDIIEKNMNELRVIRPFLFDRKEGAADDSASNEEEEQVDLNSEQSDKAADGVVRKPVNREDIKTTAQRNRDLLNKFKQKAIQKEKAQRKFHKDVENIDKLVTVDKNETQYLNKRLRKARREEADETHKQVATGVVGKAKKVGRFKYQQRKLDFQLEEDLSGNLRQMKPIGNDSLLGDRFDSIFRRNLVEPDAPAQNEKKRQRKQKYKMVNKLGTQAERMYRETMVLKARNDETARGAKQFKNNSDVILI